MAAGANRYGTNMQERLAKLGMQFDASKVLGTGQSMRGFSQPFANLNTYSKTSTSPGLAGILGAGAGMAGSLIGGGGIGSMFGKG
jgi:hypothetical protein